MESQSILILNDDCLFTVFVFMDIREVMAMENVCERFQAVAEMLYKTKHVLQFNKENLKRWTVKEVQEILKRLTPSRIHTLRAHSQAFSSPIFSLLDILRTCDNNLRSLHLEQFKIAKTSVRRLCKMFEKLKVANFKNCKASEDTAKNLRELAQPWTQLNTLHVHYNLINHGEFFLELRNIQEFDFCSCRPCIFTEDFFSLYFTHFITRNSGLKRLHIRYSYTANNQYCIYYTEPKYGLEIDDATDFSNSCA